MRTRKIRQADWVAHGIAMVALLMLFSGVAAREADLEIGKEINELCAGCHGEYGQGGKQGVYPRLAGQPYQFLVDQLVLFRERKRPNLAMLEYVDERQMPDEDIQDVSAYLARLTLRSRLPPIDEFAPDFDALARLEAAKQVLQIPLADGDIEAGRKLYRRECASCHGREGQARPGENVPMLQGQYTAYLRLQVGKYLDGLRVHDPNAPQDRLLAEFTAAELDDIFAYVSTLDD